MTDIEVALELLKLALQNDAAARTDSSLMLALYRKCYETVRSVQTAKPE